MAVYSIILAAGKGTRFGSEKPKQFMKLAGKLVIEHTVEVFEKHQLIDKIILVVNPEYRDYIENLVIKNRWRKIDKILIGGESREESAYIGVNSIHGNDNDIVLIHDSVRPLVSSKLITDVIQKLRKQEISAVDVSIPNVDTIIQLDKTKKYISHIPEREYLWKGQTPQGFKLGIIKKALTKAKQDGLLHTFTDECGIVLHYNLCKIFVVEGDVFNIKITYPIDLYVAEKLFFLRLKKIENLSVDCNYFKGKVGVIFGASSGIGKAIYNRLKKCQANVYGFSRRNNVDIANLQSVKKVLEDIYNKTGKIDFVINTAAILFKKPLLNTTYDEIISQINTNYIGTINVALASFPYLKESKGHLILFSSSSYFRGRAFYSIYSSTKSAVVNFAQAISDEWQSYGIKVNVIVPERTATPMRYRNFGKEPLDELLHPDYVALNTLKVMELGYSGLIWEVKKNE